MKTRLSSAMRALLTAVLALLVAAPLPAAQAGEFENRGTGYSPVGDTHCPGCNENKGASGGVGGEATTHLSWANDRSSVTYKRGTAYGFYCGPSDCTLKDYDESDNTKAKDLQIESTLVVWGKKIRYSESVESGSAGFSYRLERTEEEEKGIFTKVHKAGSVSQSLLTFGGIRIDGTEIDRADHIVRVMVVAPSGDAAIAEARTRTYLR